MWVWPNLSIEDTFGAMYNTILLCWKMIVVEKFYNYMNIIIILGIHTYTGVGVACWIYMYQRRFDRKFIPDTSNVR